MKRVIVKEGKRSSVADVSSGQATPTQETGNGPLEKLQSAGEKTERSPHDLEKGLDQDRDDAEDEKPKK